ncbi:MAG: GAF domain-containing sensor histidine kinase [Magnetococcales bacterium]|nr:GAF domain-containing sensor histidine kinase [Magnetococcales bacterium]
MFKVPIGQGYLPDQLNDYSALLRVGQILSEQVSCQGTMEQLLLLTMTYVGAEQTMLFSHEGEQLSLVCRVGGRSDAVLPNDLDHAYCVAGNRTALMQESPCTLRCLPLLQREDVVGVLLLRHSHATVLTREQVQVVEVLGAHLMTSLRHIQVTEDLQCQTDEVRRLIRHLDAAVEDERKRLATEIHDELGSSLTAIRFGLAALEQDIVVDDLRQRCCGLSDLARSLLMNVRRMSVSLRPPVLDRFGLQAALQWLAQQTREQSGQQLSCEVACDIDESLLDEEHRLTLFRICQEALTNVVRHAGASSCRVELSLLEQGWQLVIRDDGVGLSVEKLFPHHVTTSMGLIGMRERAQRLGGEVTFETGHQGGTTIRVVLPLR